MDENLRDTRKEIPVGQNANGADELITIPGSDVMTALESRVDAGNIVVPWPYLLGEGDEGIRCERGVARADGDHTRLGSGLAFVTRHGDPKVSGRHELALARARSPIRV